MVHVIAYRMFSAKRLHEPILTCFWMDPEEQTSLISQNTEIFIDEIAFQ